MRISWLGRHRWFLVGGFVLLLTATTVALTDTRPASVRALDWVASADPLPTTLAELSEYPAEYRLAAFQKFTPEQRSAVVREQLAAFSERTTLNAEQRDLIGRMMEIAVPGAYTDAGKRGAQQQMGTLCKRAREIFSKEQLAALSSLGPASRGESRFRTAAASAKRLLGLSVVHANAFAQCSCSSDSSCGWSCYFTGGVCASGLDGCGATEVGCGCGLIWSCDGACAPILPDGNNP